MIGPVLMLAIGGLAVLVGSGLLLRWHLAREHRVARPRLDAVLLELRMHQETLQQVTATARAQRAALEPSDEDRVARLQLDLELRTRTNR